MNQPYILLLMGFCLVWNSQYRLSTSFASDTWLVFCNFFSLLLISFLHLSFIFVVPVVIPVVAEDIWSSLPCFGQSCYYNYVLLEAWLHSMWMPMQYLWLHLSLSILLFEQNVNKDSSLFSSTVMTVLTQGQPKLFCSFWEMMMSLRKSVFLLLHSFEFYITLLITKLLWIGDGKWTSPM